MINNPNIHNGDYIPESEIALLLVGFMVQGQRGRECGRLFEEFEPPLLVLRTVLFIPSVGKKAHRTVGTETGVFARLL